MDTGAANVTTRLTSNYMYTSNCTSNYTSKCTSNFTNATSLQQLYPDGLVLAYNLFLAVIIAFGVVGNLLVLFVFSTMKVSSSTDWFILFITLLDFISSSVSVPVYLTQSTGVWEYYGNDVICKLHMYVSQVVVISSAFITAGLSIERYLKVCRPCSVLVSRNRARNVCVTSCMVSVLASIPTASFHGENNGVCWTGKLTVEKYAYFAAVFFFFVLCFIVMAFCYMKICLTIRKSARILKVQYDIDARHEEKITRVIGANKIKPAAMGQAVQVLKVTSQLNIEPSCSWSKGECSDDKMAHQTRRMKTDNESILRTNSPRQPRSMSQHEESQSTMSDSSNTSDQKPNTNVARQKKRVSFSDQSCPRNTRLHDNFEIQLESVSSINEPKRRNNRRAINMKSQTNRVQPTAKSHPIKTLQHITADIQIKRELHPAISYQRNSRQSLQTTKIALLVCLIYTVSWLIPLTCFLLIRFVGTTTFMRIAYIGRMAYLINTFTNPFLYAWLNQRFRQTLKDVCRAN